MDRLIGAKGRDLQYMTKQGAPQPVKKTGKPQKSLEINGTIKTE